MMIRKNGLLIAYLINKRIRSEDLIADSAVFNHDVLGRYIINRPLHEFNHTYSPL